MSRQTTVLGKTFFALCKQHDTPITLSLWLRFKYSHRELLNFELPISDYLEKDAKRFAGDYACASFLKKFKGLDSGIDTERVALTSFINSETICSATNRRLKYARNSVLNTDLATYLMCAKRKIARILGTFEKSKVETFFGWGPGATSTISRRKAFVDTKMMTYPITVSRQAKGYLLRTVESDLHWSAALLGIVPEGLFSLLPAGVSPTEMCKITTVPKSAKTDRTIAIEPTGSLFLQKGVGGYIRRRLKRWGVDLDNQGVNQSLAHKALELNLSTIDLASASDTLATELVYELLPVDWALFLDSLRSKCYEIDEKAARFEKFSSMGNGFTFELESLIFFALASAVTDQQPDGVVSVYGDDIIVSRESASDVIALLKFCGFTTNLEKSFVDGLFFESCGSHYFNGKYVTPPYQKEVLKDDYELFRCHNRLVRWSAATDSDFSVPGQIRNSSSLKNLIIPIGDNGDDGFLVDTDEFFRFANGARDPNLGIHALVAAPRVPSLPGIEPALLANFLRLHDGSVDPFLHVNDGKPSYGDVEIVESETNRFKRGHLLVRRWVYPNGVCFLNRH